MIKKSEKIICAYINLIGEKYGNGFEMKNLLYTQQEILDKANEIFREDIKGNIFQNITIGRVESHDEKVFIRGSEDSLYEYFRLACPDEGGQYDVNELVSKQELLPKIMQGIPVSYQGASPKDGYGLQAVKFINDYFQFVQTHRVKNLEQNNSISSKEAVWIAATVLTYNEYIRTNSNDIAQYVFAQSNIARVATTFNSQNELRTCSQVTGQSVTYGKNEQQYSYLIQEQDNKRRLAAVKEAENTRPEHLPLDYKVNTIAGLRTIRELIDFVEKQYTPFIENGDWADDFDPIKSDGLINRINFVISHYKSDFAKVAPQEQYKWEGIGWYKSYWDIEASDFAVMVESAFSKMANLLTSSMYYPYRMLVEYAQHEPETVRKLFRMLYNEELPLVQRYTAFREGFEKYIMLKKKQQPDPDKALQHYQDLRAVMVYLTCEYPEKYFLFKSRMFTTFRDRIGYVEEKVKQKSVIWKVESYTRMCQLILEQVQKDQELIEMNRARLDEKCYQDEELHLLTMDIVFFGSVYMSEDDFKEQNDVVSETEYWPSLEEYYPGITVEMWEEVLNDPSVTTTENLEMLLRMLELGGESTCAHLAEIYGNTHSYYNKLGSSFGEKVKRKYNCPDCIDKDGDKNERNRVYVIPFVGRYVIENEKKRYSWKLREELREALQNMDSSEINLEEDAVTDVGMNTILYGPPGTGKTYHTVIYAVAIIENKELKIVEAEAKEQNGYLKIIERYNSYKAQGRIEFTTFHQAYGYEEFIEGIKPVIRSEEKACGDIEYSVQPGIFKRFCERAEREDNLKAENYVFIIDEINRGNISKIFGELITLVEEAKRWGKPEGMKAVLPYSQKPFGVPKNVYLIGTMNTADRSIATIDTALRRRFFFKEMLPEPELLEEISVEDLSIRGLLERMNKRIEVLYDREHTIGHAYFMKLKENPTIEVLDEIFTNNIIPLLQEYFYEDYEKIRLVLGDNRKTDSDEQFIIAKPNDYSALFGDVEVGLDDGYIYEMNHAAFGNIESYRSI